MSPLLLLMLALQGAVPADAPDAPHEPPVPGVTMTVKGADLRLMKTVRGIADTVEAIRGQEFERSLIAVRSPDEMRVVAAQIRALNVLPRERLEARGRAWSDLGLGGPESPAVLFETLAADLEGIGFDPTQNRLLVAPDRLTEKDFVAEELGEGATVLMMTGVRIDEPLAGHLLMHVRQRERTGGDWLAETTDELLARAAWAEGEANLVAVRFLFAGMGLENEVIAHSLSPGDFLNGSLFPPGLDRISETEAALVRFVYVEGFAEVVRLFKGGSWAAVDEAMAERSTTRAFLHPPLAGKPVADWPDPKPPLDGLVPIDRDTLGQQAIVVLISTLTGKDNLGLQGGAGWAGDRLDRWEFPSGERAGQGVTRWITRWKDAEAARSFEYAFSRTLKARFPTAELPEAASGSRVLRAGGRSFRLSRSDLEVELVVMPVGLEPGGAVPAPG